MCTRFLQLLTVLSAAVALVSVDRPAAAGQTRSARDSASAGNPDSGVRPPRTPDGHPDLQGTWDFRTLTPLERPSDLAGKQVLTDEEAASLEQRAAQNRVDRAPRAGDPGTYNQFWFDFGTTVLDSKRTSLIVDPPDGKLPALTPPAQQRSAERTEAARRPAAGPEERPLWERCILGFNSGPPMMPSGYNNNFQLVQTSDYVVILNEMVHDARVVPLDRRPHGTVGQWMGDSRGRWEGDTLVIDTVHFTNHGTGTIGLRASADENLHLVERFTRTGADTLLYEFTVDDPTVWAGPWTAAVPMKRTDDHIYEYACHEGNHGMVGILTGARADDKASDEAAKRQLK
jgi:hypothetical protein